MPSDAMSNLGELFDEEEARLAAGARLLSPNEMEVRVRARARRDFAADRYHEALAKMRPAYADEWEAERRLAAALLR